MIRGDLREFLHDPLSPDAHKFRVHGGGDEDFGHFGELPDELLGTLDHRLGAEEFLSEEFKDHVGAGTQLTPAIYLVDGQGRIEFVLFVGQLDGIGNAFHQQIINIQRYRKAEFSVHNITSIL